MSVQLLDKTRKINKLLHNNESYKVIFDDVCQILGECLKASVLVVSQKGKVLGIYEDRKTPAIRMMLKDRIGDVIDNELNERFLTVLSTKENVKLNTIGISVENESNYSAIIMPIDFGGERLGTTFIYRISGEFDVDDIILSEYGNTVISLAMMQSVYEENMEVSRNEAIVKAAISSLSGSESEAIYSVFCELEAAGARESKEGLIIASHVAEKYKITRSIIVNAIKKLESAGIIEAKSSGMKGTYIKIINELIFAELVKN